MEKFIRTLSTIITSLLLYVVCAYSYLSLKGFVYNNGTFTLVSPANAQSNEDTPLEQNGIAVKLDDNMAVNFTPVYTFGDSKAPLTIYELSSLGCTHCADFHLNILPQLENDFIKSGKVKVSFVNFPLDRKSMQGAMLSECVPVLNRGKFINLMFENQRNWMLSLDADKKIKLFAADAGLEPKAAEQCLENKDLAQNILSLRQEAIDKLKMQGTPSFLVTGDGKNEIIYGVPEYQALVDYLNNRLADKK